MTDDNFDQFDQALQLEVLAASLKSDRKEIGELVETLAGMLQTAIPEAVTISRGGWFMSRNRVLDELSVGFDEMHFHIVRQKHGSFTACSKRLVRGVVLKTTEISLEQCIDQILGQLETLAKTNVEARRSLNKFVLK